VTVLGIDVGTSGTRAVIINDRGTVIASATEEHASLTSPNIGWAEQRPQDWWRACGIAIPKALAIADLSGDQIQCVGLSGQMHGAVLLDRRGDVVRPALIWCDQRTEPQCLGLAQRIGRDRILDLTCNTPLTNFTLPKLLWVRENEPDHWKRAASFLLPKDYVRYRLTDELATDVTDASGTLLFDVARRRWSSAMRDHADIDERLFPKAYESIEICGCVSAEGAAAIGLKIGTPVVAGAGDQAAGAVGMAVVRPGTVSATIGSSGVVFAATDAPVLDPQGRLHTFCHAVPGRWHVMGVTQAAGLSLRWFRDRFGTLEDRSDPHEALSAEAATVPAGADGLLWAPYLMGERTPHLDPYARAAFIGLSLSHTRAHLIRAILEGVAFSLRDSLTILHEMQVPIDTIRLGGGGARSPLWRQIQADVYGREVEHLDVDEGAALGAAILAGVAVKMWGSVDEACNSAMRVAKSTVPCHETIRTMNLAYAAFRRIYPALQSIQGD
jgi:xylulokinase